jgi:hypothetical protein
VINKNRVISTMISGAAVSNILILIWVVYKNYFGAGKGDII